jgi:monothiol glutaredoxin
MSVDSLHQEIESLIAKHSVLLFMKGTADFPACGFSNLVVQVLDQFNVPFQYVDILDRADLRQAIKDYTNWPTLPQLYINSTFIGGADIVREMYMDGTFETLLREQGFLNEAAE